MPEYKFSQIRMQLVALADSDPQLSDKALRVLLRLLVQHMNWKDGTWSATDAQLAAEFKCSTDTISRAVASIERSGLLQVIRGRWGRASRYSVSQSAWNRAWELREKSRKIADQGDSRNPQRPGISTTNLRNITSQICGPSYKKEVEEEHARELGSARASSPDLPNDGQSGGKHRDKLVFVSTGICFFYLWNDRLQTVGMSPLYRCLPESVYRGRKGYWLPALSPAPKGSREWQTQLCLLQDMIGETQAHRHSRLPSEEKSKVTHVATATAPLEGKGQALSPSPHTHAQMRARRSP